MFKNKKQSENEAEDTPQKNAEERVFAPIQQADVELKSTDKHRFMKADQEFKASEPVAKKLIRKGWAVALALMFGLSIASFGQGAVPDKSNYSYAYYMDMENTLGTNLTRDTVTNAGTGALVTDRIIIGPGTVTIQVTVTKVSGTVAGTLTLTGSMDGTNYVTINQPNIQTAVVTASLSDATARYSFSLSSNPFRYYKVGTAGGTTCVYYLDAKFMKH